MLSKNYERIYFCETSNVEPHSGNQGVDMKTKRWALDNKVMDLSASHKTGNSFDHMYDFLTADATSEISYIRIFVCGMNSVQRLHHAGVTELLNRVLCSCVARVPTPAYSRPACVMILHDWNYIVFSVARGP